MNRIIIEIEGGVLQGVYSNEPIDYILVDYDDIEAGGNLDLNVYEPDVITDKFSELYIPEEVSNEMRRSYIRDIQQQLIELENDV